MYKLNNKVQYYTWGSRIALTDRFGIANPQQSPMAELWMGAHPSASSQIFIRGAWHSLEKEIADNPLVMLGQATWNNYRQLPFLMKILAADQPLSIQVHPNLIAAKAGFERENIQGIPLNHPNRNYRDANHKPELIYALSPFTALNGFKPFAEIIQSLQALENRLPAVNLFIKNPTANTLRQLFITYLRLKDEQKHQALTQLLRVAKATKGEPWLTIVRLATYWPEDVGVFMPLLLNMIRLKPGQAMYLTAGTPHTYLQGVGIEIMANSDNVLRAGLTDKHVDINELVKNVSFKETSLEKLIFPPSRHKGIDDYDVPADDFALSVITLPTSCCFNTNDYPVLIFCLEGKCTLDIPNTQLTLNLGESAFIPAHNGAFNLEGQGTCVMATVGGKTRTVKGC